MRTRFITRLLAGAGAVAAAAALSMTISAGPGVAADGAGPDDTGAVDGCEVSAGTLTWGVKESFRSYISGSIANGSWETSEGATYETPSFGWSDPAGWIDPATGAGEVSFPGTVHFTGHDGVLDLTLANPTLEFEDDGGAALLLDARSNDMEGEVSLDEQQEWVGDVSVDAELTPAGGELVLSDLPTELTNSGAGAFGGFYEAGEQLDPLTVQLEFAACDVAATVTEEDVDETSSAAPASADSTVPWLPIGLGAVALLVIGITVGMLFNGRRSDTASGGPAQ